MDRGADGPRLSTAPQRENARPLMLRVIVISQLPSPRRNKAEISVSVVAQSFDCEMRRLSSSLGSVQVCKDRRRLVYASLLQCRS